MCVDYHSKHTIDFVRRRIALDVTIRADITHSMYLRLYLLLLKLFKWFLWNKYLKIGEVDSCDFTVFTMLEEEKHCPLQSDCRITFAKIFSARIVFVWMPLKLTQKAGNLHPGLFWGLLGVPPGWSGSRSSRSAATAHCVAASGVRPSAGGWRPASTASPPPPVLRVLNIPKVVDLRLETAVKSTDKRVQ